jgi:hypothetical protein
MLIGGSGPNDYSELLRRLSDSNNSESLGELSSMKLFDVAKRKLMMRESFELLKEAHQIDPENKSIKTDLDTVKRILTHWEQSSL